MGSCWVSESRPILPCLLGTKPKLIEDQLSRKRRRKITIFVVKINNNFGIKLI